MGKLFKNVVTIVAVVAIVYFGNKGVQTYLGKQAVGDLSFIVHNLDEAKEIAKNEGKLVLADYSAIWCPSCRKLDTQVFANSDIAEQINSDFVYARLDYDTDEGAAFAKKHELVGFPRVLVLNTVGDKLAEMPLTFDPIEYEANLNMVKATFLPKQP
ncbi:MAG: thiol:disulfide interchange protein [Alphaproteobacteria bacterium]|jgi:thiol:disulfide interchange protein